MLNYDVMFRRPPSHGKNDPDLQEKHIVHGAEENPEKEDGQESMNASNGHPKPSFPVRVLRVLWRRRTWRRIRNTERSSGPHWAEISVVILTLGILIGTFTQAYIYWKQAGIMQDSVSQNERSLMLGRGQLAVAARNAKTAEDTLTDTHTMAEDATKSLNAVQEQFRLEQRPRIAVTEYVLMDETTAKQIAHPTIGRPVYITIKFKNLGHSPAFGVHVHCHLLFESEKFKLRVEPPDRPSSTLGKLDMFGSVVEPGDLGSHVTVVSVKDTYAQETIRLNPADLIGWDGTPVNVFGRISYFDQFGKSYCLPYMSEMLSTGDWATVVGFPRFTSGAASVFSVRELCPAEIPQ
jgi:hypothetical protein